MKTVQFRLSDQDIEILEELRRLAGARSIAEILRDSISLYRWAVTERKNGRKVQSVDENQGEIRELVVPGVG